MKVKEIMTQGVEKIDANKTVADAMKRMMELHITSLIVDKRGDEDSYGIITRKDVIAKVIAEKLEPSKVKIARIMSKPIITVHPRRRHLVGRKAYGEDEHPPLPSPQRPRPRGNDIKQRHIQGGCDRIDVFILQYS
ncbi:MAG: CBS domain-containing protein [Candidatus Altiarchaeota archaeon]